MRDQDIFNCGTAIFVDFAQIKNKRKRKLREQFIGFNNKTNIDIKSLDKHVTKKVESAFSVFGSTLNKNINHDKINTKEIKEIIINLSIFL